MKLSDLKINESGRITAVNCNGEQKERLYALGVYSGIKVKVLRFSCLKKSMLISANNVRVVLRRDIADGIETEIVF